MHFVLHLNLGLSICIGEKLYMMGTTYAIWIVMQKKLPFRLSISPELNTLYLLDELI